MKRSYVITIITLVFGLLSAAGLYQFIGPVFSVSLYLVLGASLYLWCKHTKILQKCSKKEVLIALVPSLLLGFFSQYFLRVDIWGIKEYWKYLNMISIAGSFYFLFLSPSYYYLRFLERKDGSLQYVQLLSGIVLLLYLTLLGIPAETFLANQEEYIVPFTDILKIQLIPFMVILVLLQLFISLLPQKFMKILRYLIFGLGAAVYLQVMFMNGNINSLTGAEYDWKRYPVFSVINMILWIIIPGICIVLGINNKKKQQTDKLFTGIAVAVLAIHMSGVVSLVIKAPADIWEYKQYLYDSAEQYAVASGENVIVFVLDAIDNNYIKELLEEKPELFDDFKDFTCYMNTCSVYDQTNESLPQMMTGYQYMDEKDISGEFYGRVKEAGYTIHFYNYEGWSSFPNINEYIDNFIQSGSIDKENEIVLKQDLLWTSVQTLTFYQILPCIIKSEVPLDKVDFYHCINIAHFQPFSDYWNEEFDANLNLWVKENSGKYFIFQHINGTHIPCEDFIDTTDYCLSIMAKMIKQMQELGIYDNSAIMIVSDHGYHDSDAGAIYPTAATPMFMLKEKNHTSDKMILSETPVYHEDIMSTLLVNMDLFRAETDYELFGPSIYDFNENSVRTRKWYDMELSGDGFRIYQYTGDTEELEWVVREDIYTTMSFDQLKGK